MITGQGEPQLGRFNWGFIKCGLGFHDWGRWDVPGYAFRFTERSCNCCGNREMETADQGFYLKYPDAPTHSKDGV